MVRRLGLRYARLGLSRHEWKLVAVSVILGALASLALQAWVLGPQEQARERAAMELNRADLTIDTCRGGLDPEQRGQLNDALDTLNAAYGHFTAGRIEQAETMAADATRQARDVGCDLQEPPGAMNREAWKSRQ